VPADSVRIVALFTATAVVYGVVHDQVTARVCIEYFTLAHPRIVPSDAPAVVGLAWGLLASAPAGAFAGGLVALAARDGPRPPLDWRHFLRAVMCIAAAMAAIALLAGLAGHRLAARGVIRMIDDYAHLVPVERHPRFMAVVHAHLASFGVGLVGTLWVALRAQRLRASMAR
jgi:hypothetical protein